MINDYLLALCIASLLFVVLSVVLVVNAVYQVEARLTQFIRIIEQRQRSILSELEHLANDINELN